MNVSRTDFFGWGLAVGMAFGLVEITTNVRWWAVLPLVLIIIATGRYSTYLHRKYDKEPTDE